MDAVASDKYVLSSRPLTVYEMPFYAALTPGIMSVVISIKTRTRLEDLSLSLMTVPTPAYRRAACT